MSLTDLGFALIMMNVFGIYPHVSEVVWVLPSCHWGYLSFTLTDESIWVLPLCQWGYLDFTLMPVEVSVFYYYTKGGI